MTSNVWTNQNIWRHFRPWNIKKMAYFFDKSQIALEFFQHRVSKLKFINLERNNYFFFRFSTGNTSHVTTASQYWIGPTFLSSSKLLITWANMISMLFAPFGGTYFSRYRIVQILENIIPVKVLSCCFQIMVKSSNNIQNPPFLFQSQLCSHFLIKGYSFFINVYIRLSNKVWFIPARCDIKIGEPNIFKFSFKSFN